MVFRDHTPVMAAHGGLDRYRHGNAIASSLGILAQKGAKRLQTALFH